MDAEQDLRLASAKNPSVLLELDMDGNIQYLGKTWEAVVGTQVRKLLGRPIESVVQGSPEDKRVFSEAIRIMVGDDTSYRVRFMVSANDTKDVDEEDGQLSGGAEGEEAQAEAQAEAQEAQAEAQPEDQAENRSLSSLSTNGELIELEGQGILIHDRASGLPTHSMWILKPYSANQLSVQIPQSLAENLGFGTDIFLSYLAELSDEHIINEQDAPPPPQVLCRICEQHVPSWWLEKHSELCYNENKCESDLQLIHDTIIEQKQRLLALVESYRADPPVSPTAPQPAHAPESHRRPQGRSRSGSVLNTNLRFPFKNLSLLIELCDHAIAINPSEFNDAEHEFQFSPNTRAQIDIISTFKIQPTTDPTIDLLSRQTEQLVRDKIDEVNRFNSSLVYSQKIKQEVDSQILATIAETIMNIRNQTNAAYDQKAPQPAVMNIRNQTNAAYDQKAPQPAVQAPQPTAAQSNIFLNSYLGTDSLPTSRSGIHSVLLDSHDTSSGKCSPQRSITPNESVSGSPAIEVSQPYQPAESSFSLVRSPILTPKRKSSPIISTTLNFNSPMSSIQRNSVKTTDNNNYLNLNLNLNSSSSSTPFGSPLIDSYGNKPPSFSKAPLSPLILATTSSAAKQTSSPSIKDYEVIKPISKGAFGSVYLARRKITGDYFAIKVLKKSDMIAKNQVTNVKSERAIMMAQSDSPYVAKLYSSFQSKDYLFLVMEYLPGGDCSTLVKLLGNLPDKWAKQYIAEVVVGVEDLHKKGILHHDLKPDNLLVDANGHLKLTDFGLSRMGLINRQERIRHKNSFSNDDNILNPTSLSSIMPNRKNSIPSLTLNNNNSTGSPNVSMSSASSSPTSNFFENMVRSHDRTGSNSSNHLNVSNSDSPYLKPLNKSASQSSFAIIDDEQPPHNLTLFDPENSSNNKKFVGTPDYLSPETIEGKGETEAADWWSVGCILFEFLFGYPPFHSNTPEKVFQNILKGEIDWPNLTPAEEEQYCTSDAKDLIKKLLTMDPNKRLGANGAEEIKNHPYFSDINWNQLYEVEGSFVPNLDDLESTDYFETRGAALEDFPSNDLNMDSGGNTSNNSDSDSEVMMASRGSITPLGTPLGTPASAKQHISLAIPLHLRERRPSKLNENVGEFGSFQFRNLPALDKANKDVINRIKAEHLEHRNSISSSSSESASIRPHHRSSSPSSSIIRNHSPKRSPIMAHAQLLSSEHSSYKGFNNDEYGMSYFEMSGRSSPSTDSGSPSIRISPAATGPSKPQTPTPIHTPRSSRASIFQKISDFSPSSSDTEDSAKSSALQRIQRRRRESSKISSRSNSKVYSLDVLLCEPIPIFRYSLKKDLETLGCTVVAVAAGDEIIRRATGEVKFDVIITALKLPKLGAIDIAKLLRHTSSVNSDTPIIAVTAFYNEAESSGIFNGVLEKPVGIKQLRCILEKHCDWRFNEDAIVSDTEGGMSDYTS